jgi:plasmid maintenance system antidote protein VapI
MTNVELLQKKIAEAGAKPVALAAAMKVSMPTYYKLINGGGDFTASMIVTLTKALHLTMVERDLIFLTESVSYTHE